MGKSLFLALLVLSTSVLVLIYALTYTPAQVIKRRDVGGGQLPGQPNQDRFAEAIVNKFPIQVPVDGKRPAERHTNFNIPVEKFKPDDGDLQPLIIDRPPLPKPEPAKTGNELPSILPDGLPLWFRALDKDEDGQVGLYEWRKSGKTFEEFRKMDLNGDNFITAEEIRRPMKPSNELRFDNGQAIIHGAIESTDEMYNGNKLSKIFTVKFEKGKTYQIDNLSKSFDAFLYLEDPDGKVLAEDDDGGGGTESRIVHEAARTGTYRIIATSLGGGGSGPFSLSVRIVGGSSHLTKGLPTWFKELDKDKDGQISLLEWRQGGKTGDEFRSFDLNGNGIITSAEALQQLSRMPIELKFNQNQAKSNGAIESTDVKYQGKKLSKTFVINFEKGRTYQIDVTSKEFSAYLYLEDLDGNILDKIHSGGKGLTARIVYTATDSGAHRLVVTSQEGSKTGGFSIAVRAIGK